MDRKTQGVMDVRSFRLQKLETRREHPERAINDENYIPEPFPEDALEPLEWGQILATIDACAISDQPTTRFCDPEGNNVVPYFGVQAVTKLVHEPKQLCLNTGKQLGNNKDETIHMPIKPTNIKTTKKSKPSQKTKKR